MTSELLVEGFSDFSDSLDCVRLPNKSSNIVTSVICADMGLIVLAVSQVQPFDVCRRWSSSSGVPPILHLGSGSKVPHTII